MIELRLGRYSCEQTGDEQFGVIIPQLPGAVTSSLYKKAAIAQAQAMVLRMIADYLNNPVLKPIMVNVPVQEILDNIFKVRLGTWNADDE